VTMVQLSEERQGTDQHIRVASKSFCASRGKNLAALAACSGSTAGSADARARSQK
jgi:hypothetical protein